MSFVNTVDLVGDETLAASIIDRSITEIADDMAPDVGQYTFYGCSSLVLADFRAVDTVGNYAFYGCTALETANFPAATLISNNAFQACSALTRLDFPLVTSIVRNVFRDCVRLTTLILRSETVCTLGDTYSFSKTPIASGTGYIYVPAALVDSYKGATNWKTYANQFRAIEDYTVDGTITGELDPSKI